MDARLPPEKLRAAARRGFRRFLLDSMPRRLGYILGDERAARLIIEASEKATIDGFREMLEGLGVRLDAADPAQVAAMVSMGINAVMGEDMFSPTPEAEGRERIRVRCLARDACSLPLPGVAFFTGMYSGALRFLGYRAAGLVREPGQRDRERYCMSVSRPEFIVWFDRRGCCMVIERLTC